MKKAAFQKSPEFARFTEVMKRLIAVPKSELDEQIKLHEESSRRNPSRPGPKPKTARS